MHVHRWANLKDCSRWRAHSCSRNFTRVCSAALLRRSLTAHLCTLCFVLVTTSQPSFVNLFFS